jgi:hypothetical protein
MLHCTTHLDDLIADYESGEMDTESAGALITNKNLVDQGWTVCFGGDPAHNEHRITHAYKPFGHADHLRIRVILVLTAGPDSNVNSIGWTEDSIFRLAGVIRAQPYHLLDDMSLIVDPIATPDYVSSDNEDTNGGKLTAKSRRHSPAIRVRDGVFSAHPSGREDLAASARKKCTAQGIRGHSTRGRACGLPMIPDSPPRLRFWHVAL